MNSKKPKTKHANQSPLNFFWKLPVLCCCSHTRPLDDYQQQQEHKTKTTFSSFVFKTTRRLKEQRRRKNTTKIGQTIPSSLKIHTPSSSTLQRKGQYHSTASQSVIRLSSQFFCTERKILCYERNSEESNSNYNTLIIF